MSYSDSQPLSSSGTTPDSHAQGIVGRGYHATAVETAQNRPRTRSDRARGPEARLSEIMRTFDSNPNMRDVSGYTKFGTRVASPDFDISDEDGQHE